MSDIIPSSPAAGQPPSDILLESVLALLAPIFLPGSGNDLTAARRAALETVNACRAGTQADLITVAQVVAFGMAALASLGLSMNDSLSPSMVLRLRGSANACSRAAERARQALHARGPAGAASGANKPQAAVPASPAPHGGPPIPVSSPPAKVMGQAPAARTPKRPDQRASWTKATALSPSSEVHAALSAALHDMGLGNLLDPSVIGGDDMPAGLPALSAFGPPLSMTA